MSADTSGLIPAHTIPANNASRAWFFALCGAVSGACAVAALIYIGSASAVSHRIALHGAATPAPLAFGMQDGWTRPRMLKGIGGEILVAASQASPKPQPQAIPDTEMLSPTAWDRLSAGDCISLTTVSGKKLSFRIIGARNTESDKAAPQNIDLAVSACAPGSDAVSKAIIESKDEPKQNAVQRNL